MYWASHGVLFVHCKTSNIPKLSNSWLSCHVMSRVSQLVHCAEDLKSVYMCLSVHTYVSFYMYLCLYVCMSIRVCVRECVYENRS